jgi:uncharacterized membrane protein
MSAAHALRMNVSLQIAPTPTDSDTQFRILIRGFGGRPNSRRRGVGVRELRLMTENPYIPPNAALACGPELSAGSYDVGRCLEDGWTLTWSSFPTWLGVGSAFAVLSALAAVTFVGIFLLVPVLAWGATLFCLNVIDRRESFGDLFAGFAIFGAALTGMLAWYICHLLFSFIGESLNLVGGILGSGPLVLLGQIAEIFWALLVMPRLYFAPFLIVDQGMGPLEALQTSWDLTGDQKLKTAGLALLTLAISLAGALALLIGVIPALNMAALMWASAYRQMVGASAERELIPELGPAMSPS